MVWLWAKFFMIGVIVEYLIYIYYYHSQKKIYTYFCRSRLWLNMNDKTLLQFFRC